MPDMSFKAPAVASTALVVHYTPVNACRELSAQSPKIAAQSIAVIEQSVERGLCLSPNGKRTRENLLSCCRQRNAARPPVLRVDGDLDPAAPLQRLERRRQCRAIHAKQSGHRGETGRLGAVQRHHQRELSVGQAQRAERVVEAPCQSARRAL